MLLINCTFWYIRMLYAVLYGSCVGKSSVTVLSDRTKLVEIRIRKHSKSPNSGRSNYLCCLFKLRPDLFRFGQSFGDLGSLEGLSAPSLYPCRFDRGLRRMDLEDFWLVSAPLRFNQTRIGRETPLPTPPDCPNLQKICPNLKRSGLRLTKLRRSL